MALDPITSIVDLGSKIIDKIFPDKNEAEKTKLRFAEMAQQGQLEELKNQLTIMTGQMEINKEEAKSQSVFVAGWRPFSGWICGVALGYYYIMQPFLVWILSVFSVETTAPALDLGELITILTGLLGMGALRSVDKRV